MTMRTVCFAKWYSTRQRKVSFLLENSRNKRTISKAVL
jgi:hypothetical protein